MYSMSSSRQNEAQISEPLPCPECGAIRMQRTTENCRLDDGLAVKRLRHFKCMSCGARFFDDDAMHLIQQARLSHAPAHAV
jgi:DNA-directed RNA polymerase subunit RPC12/RpoP